MIYRVINSELDLRNAPGCKDLKRVTDATSGIPYYPESFFAVCIRGDLDVNETKVKNFIGDDIHPAQIIEDSGIVAGFIGPKDITKNAVVLFDSSFYLNFFIYF